MVEINEVIVLIVAVLGYAPILIAYLKNKELFWLFTAYTLFLIGCIVTIIEEFLYPDLLNFIEHFVGIMGMGILCFVCAFLSHQKMQKIISKVTIIKNKRSITGRK